MRYLSLNLFVPGIILAVSAGALAQGPSYQRGRTPSPEEIRAWDIDVSPEGKGLPPGSGTAMEGAKIYAQRCMQCHGPTGQTNNYGFGSPQGSLLVPRTGPNGTPNPPWPLATIVWDHIHKAMPRFEEGSLSVNQVYAATAYVLYLNGLIAEADVMDAQSLPKVQMPKRSEFIRTPAAR